MHARCHGLNATPTFHVRMCFHWMHGCALYTYPPLTRCVRVLTHHLNFPVRLAHSHSFLDPLSLFSGPLLTLSQVFEEHDEEVQEAEAAEQAPQGQGDRASELRPMHHKENKAGIPGDPEDSEDDDDDEVGVTV
jgi:hypothetical protein